MGTARIVTHCIRTSEVYQPAVLEVLEIDVGRFCRIGIFVKAVVIVFVGRTAATNCGNQPPIPLMAIVD